MVQVLPYVPSFGEQITPHLSQAIGSISQNFLERKNRSNDQRLFAQFAESPNLSPMQQIQMFSKLSPQSQQTLSPLFQHLLTNQSRQQAAEAKIGAKQQEKAAVEQKEHQEVSDITNDLVDELVKGKTGFFNQWNKIFPKGRESRAYFDELALGIEKRLANMVGKGALSERRFNYLVKNLPSSSDTDATNRGKLKALAKEFKVDIHNPEFKKQTGEEKISEKVNVYDSSGKLVGKISQEEVAQLPKGYQVK